MRRSLLPAVLSLSLLLSALVSAQDASYTFTTRDVPGATLTHANGINPAGLIVGTFDFGDATGAHGFLKNGATFTTIDVPGATSTSANGINLAGQIVGYFRDATGHDHGFLTDGAMFTTIDVPGALVTYAQRINSAGQIVGIFGNATGAHGFLATPKLDFIQLRGIANHVHEAVKHDTGNLYPVGLRL
jgi:probable HAF family extracellular repeat protein